MRRALFTNDLKLRDFLVEIIEAIEEPPSDDQPLPQSENDQDLPELFRAETGPTSFPKPVDPTTITEEYLESAPMAALPIKHYLPQLKEHLAEITKGLEGVEDQKGERITLTGKRNKAMEDLAQVCRQFIAAMLARHDRLALPEGDVLKARLRNPSNRPHSLTHNRWIHVARDLISADTRFQEKGHPPMANPSAAEIQERMEVARETNLAVKLTDDRALVAERFLRGRREATRNLSREVAAFLGYIYAYLPGSESRRIVRKLGFSFVSDFAEETNPESEEQPILEGDPNNQPSAENEQPSEEAISQAESDLPNSEAVNPAPPEVEAAA